MKSSTTGIKAFISGKWYFAFPLLIAVYPILFLYSQNVQELFASQIVVPVVLAVLLTVAAWACLALFTRDALKAGFVVTIFIVFFYAYGTVFDWLVSTDLFEVKHRYLLPVFLFVAAYLGYFMYRIGNRELFRNAGKILTGMCLVLIILNVGMAIPSEYRKFEYAREESIQESLRQESIPGSGPPATNSSGYPDIYYIVLDEYASSDTIREIWGYDNSGFEKFLEERGFYIARNSMVGEPFTISSIASTLNMEPVTGTTDLLTQFSLINNNKVMAYLKDRGYTTFVVEGIKEAVPAKGDMRADYIYEFNNTSAPGTTLIWRNDAFSNILVEKSMLKAFSYRFQLDVTQSQAVWAFEMSRSIGLNTSPKFVYIHIKMPHQPFILDADGNYIEQKNSKNWEDKRYYRGQYIFTTRQTELMIDFLLKDKDHEKIIILQSDHGPRPAAGLPPGEGLQIPARDSLKVFNAMLLPDGSEQYLYQDISPINTFRFIFNHTFHDDIDLVEDT